MIVRPEPPAGDIYPRGPVLFGVSRGGKTGGPLLERSTCPRGPTLSEVGPSERGRARVEGASIEEAGGVEFCG